MNPLIEQALNNPDDLLLIADRITLSVKHCNKALLDELNQGQDKCRGKNVHELIGEPLKKEGIEEILHSVNKLGLYIDQSTSAEYNLYFTPINCPDEPCCLVRLSRKERDSRLKQYSLLIENSVAGMFQSLPSGSLLDCNNAFAQILGYSSKSDLIGIPTGSFYFSEKERQDFLEAIRKTGRVSNYEMRLKKKDGTLIYCLENTYLNKTEEGQEVIIGTIIDVTAQKIAERAIHESEERLNALASVSHESVVFFDDNGIVDCNDQFVTLFGYINRREIVGQEIRSFFTPPDLNKLYVAMDISGSNKTEIRSFSRNGQPIILEVSGIYIQLGGKRLRVFVISDLTTRKKAEFTLEQTVLRLRNVLESSPNAIIISTDDHIRYTNQSALDLLGVKFEDEIYDSSILRFIESDYLTQVQADFEEIQGGGEVDYREIKIQNTSGKSIDVGLKCTLTIYENKPSIQISLTNISERMQLIQEQMRVRIIEEINTILKREIEEHKITQQRLEAQENYTRNLIESSLDMIIACDRDYCISEFNRAAEQQFGFKRDEVLGKPVDFIYARPGEKNFVKGVLEDKGSYFGEIVNRRKDGSVFQSLLSTSVIRDDKQKVIGSMSIARDITEYRANERKALEQSAKLESIFNSTENVMMWTMDREHRATTINSNFQSWLMSQLGEDVNMGDDILKIFHSHVDIDLYQNQLQSFDMAFDGRPQQFEFALKSVGDRTIWMQAFLNPVYLDDALEEISCLMYDTTERKIIDRRIREALREKEILLQEIHHRVKNNLQVISSILNLQSSYVNDPKTLDILMESQNRIKSMSFIHETLYRTSDFSSIDFSEYLRTLSGNLIQSYRLNDCKIHFEAMLQEINIHIDQAIPCGLIVNELVSNALKYAFKGRKEGRLVLSLKLLDRKVYLLVADDGIGLPDDFRQEKTDSLGIQLVYTLTEQLDGQIEVKSTHLSGTEFLITFEMSVG